MRFLVLLLFIVPAITYPSNNFIIINEDGTNENLQKTLAESPINPRVAGIGAMGHFLLLSLWQKAAPVLVPLPLWELIVGHRDIFGITVSKSFNEFYSQYKRYNRFKDKKESELFYKQCRFYNSMYNRLKELIRDSKSNDKLKQAIWSDPVFDIENAPPEATIDGHKRFEIMSYIMCAYVPTSSFNTYLITDKQNKQFYLFVPKKPTQLLLRSSYRLVSDPFKLSPPKKILKDSGHYDESLLSVIKNLLPRCRDRKTNQWVFYITGHGTYDEETEAYIEKKLQELDKIKKQLQDFELERQKLAKDLALRKKELEDSKNTRDSNYKKAVMHNYNVYVKNLEIASKNQQICLRNIEIINQAIDNFRWNNVTAGFRHDLFKQLFIYLQNNVPTSLVYYDSCSSGGKPAIDVFLDKKTGKQLTFSYPIVSGGLTEGIATSISPTIALDFYRYGEDTLYYIPVDKLVDWQTNSISLATCYNLNNFFKYAHTKPVNDEILGSMLKSISQLCSNNIKTPDADNSWQKLIKRCYKKVVHTIFGEKKGEPNRIDREEVANIPSIRLPGKDHFNVIDINNRFYSISKNGNKHVVNPEQDVVLLYIPNIGNIEIIEQQEKLVPAFVSMIPGKAIHNINSIQANTYQFSDVISSFFSCPQIALPKMFHVKQIACINDIGCRGCPPLNSVQRFQDIIFFNKLLVGKKTVNGVIWQSKGSNFLIEWGHDKPAPLNFDKYVQKASVNYRNQIHKFFSDVKLSPNAKNTPLTLDVISDYLQKTK